MRSTRGFSLIELVIVVVVVGIMAGIALPRMSNTADSVEKLTDDLIKSVGG